MFGYSARTFGMFQGSAVAVPVMSSAGALSFARNLGYIGIPALVGISFGLTVFGDRQQFWSLLRNNGTFRREFKAVHKELYTYA